MKYEIILEAEEDGIISAHVPCLPGCHSWGNTREEVLNNVKKLLKDILKC